MNRALRSARRLDKLRQGLQAADGAQATTAPVARHSSLFTRHCFSRRSSLVTASEGQAQVEFVLSALFVVLLIFSVFELIMLLYTYNVLADSAKEGVRYGVVHGSLSANATSVNTSENCSAGSLDPVFQQVCNYAAASFHDISGMSVTVNYLDANAGATPPDPGNEPPDRVQVLVSYPYKPLLGLSWEATTVNIKAAAEGRITF